MSEQEVLTDTEKRARFVNDFVVQIAMWADENLFGHGLTTVDYEDECERLSAALYDESFVTLLERPER
jgi:hypothetical protein